MSWVGVAGLAIGVGTSVVKGVKANKAKKKAEAEAKALQQNKPILAIQPETIKNQQLAEQAASGGLSGGTKNYLETERNRGLSSSLQALKESGAPSGLFDKVMSGFDESLTKQGALDSQAHTENLQMLMGANKDLAGARATAWGVNEYAPFENQLKELTERRAAETTNLNNAITEGASSVLSFGTSQLANGNMLKGLFKDNSFSTPKSSSINFNRVAVSNSPDTSGINTSSLRPATLELN